MGKKQSIEIRINDLPERVPEGSSLETLIKHFNERDPDLIVELNGRFIYPRDYAVTIVTAGDEIEFMNPNFGG
jgi:thiamine biosynthesis protein ThiS